MGGSGLTQCLPASHRDVQFAGLLRRHLTTYYTIMGHYAMREIAAFGLLEPKYLPIAPPWEHHATLSEHRRVC